MRSSLGTGILISCFVLILSSCPFVAAPVGGLYTDVRGPGSATSNAVGRKTGTATCTSILGIVATGDCSIEAASKQGGITRIHHVDYQSKGVFGLMASFTTIVYGD